MDEFKQDEEEEVQKEDGEEEDAKEADVYEANPRYTIEQDPEQGEVLRSEIQKGDTVGKILGDWMDANDLAELLAAGQAGICLNQGPFRPALRRCPRSADQGVPVFQVRNQSGKIPHRREEGRPFRRPA